MFAAYFDASGTNDTPVLSFAGFVSRTEKWTRFERKWRDLLPGTVQKFHMTDFVSSRKGWESWRDKGKERVELFNELLQCIKRNTNKGCASSIVKNHYDEANAEFALAENGFTPYVVCGLSLLAQIRAWANSKRVDLLRIQFFLEDGDSEKGALIAKAKSEGFDITSLSK